MLGCIHLGISLRNTFDDLGMNLPVCLLCLMMLSLIRQSMHHYATHCFHHYSFFSCFHVFSWYFSLIIKGNSGFATHFWKGPQNIPLSSLFLCPHFPYYGGSGLIAKSIKWPPWTVAHQAPLSMGFSRQEYWSGLPFPSLGSLLKTIQYCVLGRSSGLKNFCFIEIRAGI